jgi:outer membrane protein with beta-barrel domain
LAASPCAFAHTGSTSEQREKMKRTTRWSLIGAVVLASTLGVSSLQAQANPIAFGIVAGASVPLGDFGDAVKMGWHAGGLVQWNGAAFPLGIRGEVVYHSFGSEQDAGEDVDFNILTATVNGVFMFPMTEPATVRPYIIGGGGLYRVGCSDCGGLDAENKGGINIGAGVQIPLSGFTSIIEARWHMIFDSDDTIADDSNTTFIPISVGLLFR